MKTRLCTALLGLGVVALAGVLVGTARAQTEGQATFGSQWWTQNKREAKFEEFRQVPLGGFLGSFDLHTVAGRRSFLLVGKNGLQRDQATTLTWRDGVRYRLDVGYARTPHLFSRTARSPFTSLVPGVLTVPDSLQRTIQNLPSASAEARYQAIMTDLLGNSPRVSDEFTTDTARARLRARADRHWTFELRGMRRNRSGSKNYGTSFGLSNTLEVPLPIDQRIVETEAMVEYKRSKLTVQGDFGVTDFHNAVDRLLVDNPKRLTDAPMNAAGTTSAPAHGQLDLAPDNRAVHGNLALAVALPRRSAFDAHVSVSQARQNETFLPHTVNSSIVAIDTLHLLALPAPNADAEALVISQDYRLSSRQFERVTARVRLHHDKYDNKTPQLEFPAFVNYDNSFSRTALESDPFSNSQLVTGVDADVDVLNHVTVGGTYEFRRRERTHREVEQDDESVFAGRLRMRPVQDVSLRAEYRHGRREGDAFDDKDYRDAAGAFIEQPGLRRFDIADRKQSRVKGEVSWMAASFLSLGAGYNWVHNDYDASDYGLRDEERHGLNANGMVSWNDRLLWSVGGGIEDAVTDQRSRQSATATADTTTVPGSVGFWTANLRDRNRYLYTTAEWWAAPEKLSLGVNYLLSRASGAFDLWGINRPTTPPVPPAPPVGDLADTRYDFQDLSFEARWHLRSSCELVGRYGFERFDVTDFATENVPLLNTAITYNATTGLPVVSSNAVFLGDSMLDYRAHKVALVVTQRF